MIIKGTGWTNFKVEVSNPIFHITPKFVDLQFTAMFNNVTPTNGKQGRINHEAREARALAYGKYLAY